jgi:type I restriction enzyme S subunit
VTSGELKNKFISDTKEKISESAARENRLELYEPGTVVIAIYGLEAEGVRGTASIVGRRCAISQACMAFSHFKGVDNEFFYYWYLLHGSIIGGRFAQGTKQQNLSAEIVGPLPISFPDKQAQRKIAKILSTQDKIIDLWNQKIDQLRLLKKLCLRKMFPRGGSDIPEVRFPGFTGAWRRGNLGDIAQFSKGAGYSKADLRESGTPIILYGRLYTKYELEIADVDTFAMAQPDAVYSRGGELIIPASGETAEDIAIASVVGNPGILIGGDINILFPSSEIDATFMAMSLSGGPAHNEVAKRAQGKSVVHLHNADLEKVMLSYPSLKEQKRISAFFRLVEHLIALHQRRLAAEEEKKKALMQLLLTGIVRV